MAVRVTKRYHSRIRKWGKALFIRDVSIPMSLVNILEDKYYEGFGHVAEIELPEWLYKKNNFQSLEYWEIDENNNYINRKSND